MDLATIRAALVAWVADITGIAVDNVYWRERPMGFTARQYAVLKLTGTQQWGHDEIDWDYDNTAPAGVEMTPHQKGLRQLRCEIRFWSHDATDIADALSLCEIVRDRVILPDTVTAWTAAGIGFAEVSMVTDLPNTQDDRAMSVAQIDLKLNALADTTGTPTGYVDTWQVTGTADDVDGATYPIMTDEVIP